MRNKPPEDFPPLGVTTISSPPPEHTLGHNGETTAVPSRVHSLARRGAQKRSWTSMYAEAAGGGNHGIILPGQQILVEEGCMRGLGTYEKGGKIFASVCGILEKVNKLVYVRPLRSRYMGSVGDVVVGRITEILNGKWLVDVNAGQAASLALAAISLPEQRRRLDEDLLEMQNFFVPNDMICCEVQRVRADGQLMLHTRSARYGRLLNGTFVAVAPQQIKRQSHHIVQLSCGVQVVLGLNGYIWISLPMKTSAKDTLNYAHVQTTHEKVSVEKRREICRVRNIILCLAKCNFDISVSSIERMYGISVAQGCEPKELLDPGVLGELMDLFLAGRMEDA